MPSAVQPRYIPVPCQEAAESGRLILRDGTTAQIRVAQPSDELSILAFFQGLSTEAKRRRFFTSAAPTLEQVAKLCDSSDPDAALTLLVTRVLDGKSHVMAAGSYHKKRSRIAEVAFAVDDSIHGKGLGTLLLERLALVAARHGFERFWALTQFDNREMLEVFRQSGFAVEERMEGGFVEVDFSVAPSAESVAKVEMRDRLATVASLRPFFQPNAVAVVGASRDPNSIGYRILEALVMNRFQGPVYPVNPKATVVGCIRAFSSVRDLPEAVDLAIVSVPRGAVPAVVDECAARGVRALVVITAGFSEVSGDGGSLQKRLVEQVRGHGMRMVGPNCMGLLNTDPAVRLNASFSPVYPPAGRVAMSSQSGALGLAVLAAAERFNLGLSTFVSVGNKADVSGNDLLQYWEEDENTDVILLYLESFGNPRRFARIARRVSQRKPIVAIKSGRSKAGGRAAGSHTAALAADDAVVDALFRQTGVLRADTLEEMFDLAAALGSQPLPAGKRVAIITNAGGPGILCADACEAGGLTIPELSPGVKEQLAAFLPAAASLGNPVDMIASAPPEHYRQTIAKVLASGEADAVIVLYIPVGLTTTDSLINAVCQGVAEGRKAPSPLPLAPAAGESGRSEGCTVLACLMADRGVRTQFDRAGERIPSYAFPESAARVLCKAAAYAEWRDRPHGVIPDFEDLDVPTALEICRRAVALHGPGWLSAADARTVLAAMKLPVAAGGMAATAEEAEALARRVGFPVAVKLASRQLVHKTEAGGVRLNLADVGEVRGAFEQMRERLAQANQLDAMDGVVVQPMVTGGVEVMVGVTHDQQFGPVVAFGLGGIHVEILADVCFRVTPLTDLDAAEMVRSIRGYRLLQGYRGHPPADVEALQDLLLRISRLVEDVPAIREIDLNPIIALPPGRGCCIVDARIAVGASH
jgi:acetyl coenzyme A synthetase (ADP forming)-like protein